jgi:type 1 glutamine amidotransferase
MTNPTLLVVSGGHPYDAEAFAALLSGLGDWTITHLVHPEAEEAIAGGAADEAGTMLFYDMAGYTFADGTVTSRPPSAGFVAAIERRLAAGRGMVLMHHALAGWAEWPRWAEIAGGRFLYQPGEVRGRACLDSGYRHDVTYRVERVSDHPVTREIPASFEITDELYLAEIFEDDVVPLLRADHEFVAANFYSAAHAVAGRMFDNGGWHHPPGSSLVGWARSEGQARIVTLQFGDGPIAYANPVVGRLLANALVWTAEGETQGGIAR